MNPAPGATRFVGAGRAAKLVKRGRASWRNNQTAIFIIGQEKAQADYERARYYDLNVQYGFTARHEEMRGVPIINPAALLKRQTKVSR